MPMFKRSILFIFSLVLLEHNLALYLDNVTMIDDLLVPGCEFCLDLSSVNSNMGDHFQPLEMHPRVLLSHNIRGKLFEIQHFVRFSRRIDINTAGFDTMVMLPGIGPKRARKIMDYIGEHGTIGRLEELYSIPGFTDYVVSGIQPYLVFE